MFFKLSVCLLILACVSIGQAVNSIARNDDTVETASIHGRFLNSSSSCGGNLEASSGIISYKQFEPVEPNERCVWTVRTPNATAYNVSFSNLGIPYSVIVSGFKRYGVANHTVPSSIATISPYLATSTNLVITFYTGPTNNTNNALGFSLTYSSYTSDASQWVSSKSEDVIAAADSGHIKHPSRGELYDNWELSTFVVTPVLHANGQFKNSKLVYIKDKLEGECHDSLRIYVFDINFVGINKWKYLGSICSLLDSQLIANRDLIMITFQSDPSNTFEGFHFYSLVDK